MIYRNLMHLFDFPKNSEGQGELEKPVANRWTPSETSCSVFISAQICLTRSFTLHRDKLHVPLLSTLQGCLLRDSVQLLLTAIQLLGKPLLNYYYSKHGMLFDWLYGGSQTSPLSCF